ncbi:unnamed protein product [Candidula unifasciata]|uniref:G-protein coupled receptors family 1 profile domain-containing protein n=1 Tax=Candidula unifasciata TaxID=100452 RepID=A0A8S4A4Y4_9EUPU|nr:unnamed protein product [Candidula unifasciata]
MSTNNTHLYTLDIINSTQPMITPVFAKIDYLTYATRWFNQFVVGPVICSVGIVSNVISIVIIVKSGLRKPSNIFLFGLAIADTMALLYIFDVSDYLYMQNRDCIYYGCNLLFFSYAPALTLFVFKVFLFFLSALGARLSTVITVIITAERLIAVFNPLKLKRIVTRSRAWMVLFFSLLFWLPWSIFQIFWFKFNSEYNDRFQSFTTWDSMSDYFNSSSFDVGWFSDVIISQPSHTLPLIIVAIGSLAISIKLRIIASHRQKMVSGTSVQRSASKTTKTLLMVCLIYSITRFCFVIRYIPSFYFDDSDVNKVSLFYDIIRYRFVDINSSCNFFVYVAFNPTFRHIFENLFSRRRIEEESESAYA